MSTTAAQPVSAKSVAKAQAKALAKLTNPLARVANPAVRSVKHEEPVAPPPASAKLDEKMPGNAKGVHERSLEKHRIATEQTPTGLNPVGTAANPVNPSVDS